MNRCHPDSSNVLFGCETEPGGQDGVRLCAEVTFPEVIASLLESKRQMEGMGRETDKYLKKEVKGVSEEVKEE